jgi:hypothetical protein
VVELSEALVSGLADLTAAIDDPDIDIAESVERLGATVLGAVPSYLGLCLVIEAHGRQVVLSAMNTQTVDADIATSLSMPLAEAEGSSGITLILYGATAGGFVDLAADMGWLLGNVDFDFVFDSHLSVPVDSLSGLADLSVVNQAIGVLVAGGYTIEKALEVLDALAADGDGERHLAAARLLAELDQELRPT